MYASIRRHNGHNFWHGDCRCLQPKILLGFPHRVSSAGEQLSVGIHDFFLVRLFREQTVSTASTAQGLSLTPPKLMCKSKIGKTGFQLSFSFQKLWPSESLASPHHHLQPIWQHEQPQQKCSAFEHDIMNVKEHRSLYSFVAIKCKHTGKPFTQSYQWGKTVLLLKHHCLRND